MLHQNPIIVCVTTPTFDKTSPVTLTTILRARISKIDNHITKRKNFNGKICLHTN